ncbi:hypothetical protein P171DRAFT_449886 [Karstenula rhodostoma CBS 690.94]|uniref:Uncharacterized protein n=1 Tax=Karstenula rhodostoma CBS 690.94 TaxID=1392251 RepID=A0A9P4P6L7_9PLEO|nr:hypothetical protein P171DRAFT_449886 [Karstenula rhodostoma CBS 690.94]
MLFFRHVAGSWRMCDVKSMLLVFDLESSRHEQRQRRRERIDRLKAYLNSVYKPMSLAIDSEGRRDFVGALSNAGHFRNPHLGTTRGDVGIRRGVLGRPVKAADVNEALSGVVLELRHLPLPLFVVSGGGSGGLICPSPAMGKGKDLDDSARLPGWVVVYLLLGRPISSLSWWLVHEPLLGFDKPCAIENS